MLKTYLIVIFISFVSTFAFAQIIIPSPDSTTYYIKSNGYFTKRKDSAAIVRVVINPKIGDQYYTLHDYYSNGKPKLITHSTGANGSGMNGPCVEYFPNGVKMSEENFDDDVLTGAFTAYYPNGKIYMVAEAYKSGAFIFKECYDITGEVKAIGGDGEFINYNDERTEVVDRGEIVGGLKNGLWKHYQNGRITETRKYEKGVDVTNGSPIRNVTTGESYPAADVPAQFSGGMDELSKFVGGRVHYTERAKQEHITGRVFIAFVVDIDGSVIDIKVLRGLGYGLDEEAVSVIKLTSKKWKPAMLKGQPIKSQYTIPIGFGI